MGGEEEEDDDGDSPFDLNTCKLKSTWCFWCMQCHWRHAERISNETVNDLHISCITSSS